MKFRIITRIFSVLVFSIMLFGVLPNSHANSGQAIKKRMKERLAEIEALKNSGALGENNQGFLTVRTRGEEAEKLAEAENADRRLVYQAIAATNNVKVELVGRRRALQLAEKAKPGHWFQNQEGDWKQKEAPPRQ